MNELYDLRRPLAILLVFLLGIITVSCQFSDATVVRGDGSVTTATIHPSSFHAIDLQGVYNVYLSHGSRPSVIIETDGNLQELIKTKVDDHTLKIFTERDVMLRPTRLDVHITYTELENIQVGGACRIGATESIRTGNFSIEVNGAADIDLDISVRTMQTKISGAGNIKLQGEAEVHQAELSGASNLRAEDFITGNTYVSLSGTGSAHVYASKLLDASISGIGKITYHGEPEEILMQKSGLGAIVPAGK